MKKILCVIILYGSFGCLYQSANSQIITHCADVEQGNIFLWSYKKGKEYVSNYIDNYKGKWETHTRAYYLSDTTFLFLDSFFRKHPEYEGLNAHLTVYGHRVSRNQNDDHQFLLYFTPAKSEATKKSDYAALGDFFKTISDPKLYPLDVINQGTLCPGECDSSISTWSSLDVSRTRLTQIGGGYEGFLIYDTFLLKEFKDKYRKKTTLLGIKNRRHTKSIFIDRGKIARIACFLKDSLKTHPAMGIYLGSYNEMKINKQAHKKQITIGIVPMKKVGIYLEPNPCGYINHITEHCLPLLENLKNKRRERPKSENHGELCPDDCPKGDD